MEEDQGVAPSGGQVEMGEGGPWEVGDPCPYARVEAGDCSQKLLEAGSLRWAVLLGLGVEICGCIQMSVSLQA